MLKSLLILIEHFAVILKIVGGLLLFSGVFFIGYYFCRSKKTRKRKNSRKTNRRRKPEELSRAYHG